MLNLKKWLEKYPQMALIGNTPLVKIKLFEKECPAVSIYAKCEYANPEAVGLILIYIIE